MSRHIKLTKTQIAEIQKAFLNGATGKEVSKQYGISLVTAYKYRHMDLNTLN